MLLLLLLLLSLDSKQNVLDLSESTFVPGKKDGSHFVGNPDAGRLRKESGKGGI
jgi:hypothetical protein